MPRRARFVGSEIHFACARRLTDDGAHTLIHPRNLRSCTQDSNVSNACAYLLVNQGGDNHDGTVRARDMAKCSE